jgi:hypothetical protein
MGSFPSYKIAREMRMCKGTVSAGKKVQSPVWGDCTMVQRGQFIALRLDVVEQVPIVLRKR